MLVPSFQYVCSILHCNGRIKNPAYCGAWFEWLLEHLPYLFLSEMPLIVRALHSPCYSACSDAVKNDMVTWEQSNMWPLSCYTFAQRLPCLEGMYECACVRACVCACVRVLFVVCYKNKLMRVWAYCQVGNLCFIFLFFIFLKMPNEAT